MCKKPKRCLPIELHSLRNRSPLVLPWAAPRVRQMTPPGRTPTERAEAGPNAGWPVFDDEADQDPGSASAIDAADLRESRQPVVAQERRVALPGRR